MLKKRPSPSMAVAIIALVFAVVGTAVASVATISVLNKKEKKQTRNIARNQISNAAPGLSVAHANTANSADAANSAISANTADTADTPGFAKILANGAVSAGGRGIVGVDHMTDSGTYCLSLNFTPHVAVATADAGPALLQENAQVQIPGGPAGLGCSADQVGVLTEASTGVQDLPFFIVIE